MRERDKLKQESEKSPGKWSAYKQLRNRVTRQMCNAIRDYYHRLIDTNRGNPRKMCEIVSKVLGIKDNSVKLSSVEVDGTCFTRGHDVLEALN